jgi:hypothetical protein
MALHVFLMWFLGGPPKEWYYQIGHGGEEQRCHQKGLRYEVGGGQDGFYPSHVEGREKVVKTLEWMW